LISSATLSDPLMRSSLSTSWPLLLTAWNRTSMRGLEMGSEFSRFLSSGPAPDHPAAGNPYEGLLLTHSHRFSDERGHFIAVSAPFAWERAPSHFGTVR